MIFGGLEFILLPLLFGAAVAVVAYLTFSVFVEWFTGEGALTEEQARDVEDVIKFSMKTRNSDEYVQAVYDPISKKVIKKRVVKGETVSSDVKEAHDENEIVEYP
jgi:hypothetical protein